MNQPNEVFEKTYAHYLSQLASVDLEGFARRLGLVVNSDEIVIPLLGEDYRVSNAGILAQHGQRAGFAQAIVLFKYLLMFPDEIPETTGWVAYHTFKDAQPLRQNFLRETNGRIAACFVGKLAELETAGNSLNGRIVEDTASFDLSMKFTLLPTIPLFLRFNDADEDFGAECTVLFDQTVESYLDMESVSILGSLFAKRLAEFAGRAQGDQ